MIKLVQGDTALTPEQGTTWGSLTIQIGGMQIRNAAATAKAALLDEAAKRLGVKKEELTVTDGVVSAGNRRVTYGELIGGKIVRDQARSTASLPTPRIPRTSRSSASRWRASTSPTR